MSQHGGHEVKPETVLSLFQQGLDTAEIARRLYKDEATVVRLLYRARRDRAELARAALNPPAPEKDTP